MLQELASRSTSRQEKKPITDTYLIQLARNRHRDLILQTEQALEPEQRDLAVRLLYTTHAIDEEKLDPQIKIQIRRRTWKKPLIDLGAGNGLDPKTIKYFGFWPYIGVDLLADSPSRPQNLMINSDALSHLFRRRDGFGNVMANGFLCRDWFTSGMEGYVDRTLQHIRRVLPRDGGIFITSHFEFTEEAERAGLVINPELSKVRTNILVFERGPLPRK